MNKRTFILVAFLILVTLGLVLLAVYSQTPPTPSVQRNPQASFAHTTLAISNATLVASPSSMYKVDVKIQSNDNKITAVQLEMSFDPNVLSNVDIQPGQFIQTPVILLKKVDQTQGRISFAEGVPLGQKGLMGTGTVATITFTPISQTQTSINFLPKTQVTAQGLVQSVLRSSSGGMFTFPALYPTPQTGTSSAR
jgi:hypothetical protein